MYERVDGPKRFQDTENKLATDEKEMLTGIFSLLLEN